MSQAPMTAPDLKSFLDVEEQESSVVQKGSALRLFSLVLGYPGLLASGVGLVLVATVASLGEPRIFGFAIDDAITPKDWDKLKLFAYAFFSLEVIRVFSVIGHTYLFEKLGQKVMQELRVKLLAHLQALPMSIYDRNPAGKLVTRVTNDISTLAEMFSAGFVTLFANILAVVGILIGLLWLDLKLGLISAAIFPFTVFISAYFSRKLRVTYREARSRLSALNGFLAENIQGMRVVHLFNRAALHRERFARINSWYADAQLSTGRIFALFQPSITWSSGIAVALLIWFGGNLVMDGRIKLGVWVAFFTYVLSLFQPMREIADKWNLFLSGMASAERIFSILKWKPETDPELIALEAKPLPGILGHLVFEDVWFAYDDEHWVLRGFSLEIKPGTRLGVVGHTGAGKTTLISLLMRFYQPQKGRILLDGRDLREYDLRSLRATFGIIQQDVFMFSGSVEENILLWKEEDILAVDAVERQRLNRLSRRRLLDQLQSVGIPESWLQMRLVERGSNLSAGQRQVVAFARALAQTPAVWILDEATANIDSESEIKLQEALKRAALGKTTLMIAHRLATIRDADRIIVIHKGLLLEEGNHLELMASNGLYARLFRYQNAVQSAADSAVGQ